MSVSEDILFSPLKLRNLELKNRLVRSATYEGWGDPSGVPRLDLSDLYYQLARGGVGMLITGFVFTSQTGRAMQPGQCGIDTGDKIAHWQRITDQVRRAADDVRLIMQLAHAGRQTLQRVTGGPVVGVSSRKCTYFRQRVTVLDDAAIRTIVDEFAHAAHRAREAGFDGVQVHAAHGYLVHQFLSPWTNRRTDRWSDRPLFLEEVIRAVQTKCGERFPVLVKLSAVDDNTPGLRIEDTIATVKRVEELGVDAVEISYGTMEYALNIIRGAWPVDTMLEVNPFLNHIPRLLRRPWKTFFLKRHLCDLRPFAEDYNVALAAQIKQATYLPIIPVGGLRSAESMRTCLTQHGLAAVSLSRPLICEPDLPNRIRNGLTDRSNCTSCNQCAVHCDGPEPLHCYQGNTSAKYHSLRA